MITGTYNELKEIVLSTGVLEDIKGFNCFNLLGERWPTFARIWEGECECVCFIHQEDDGTYITSNVVPNNSICVRYFHNQKDAWEYILHN